MHPVISSVLQFLSVPSLTSSQTDSLLEGILSRWEGGSKEEQRWALECRSKMSEDTYSKQLKASVNEAVLISSLILVLENSFPFDDLVTALPVYSSPEVKAMNREVASRGVQINRKPQPLVTLNQALLSKRLEKYLQH